MKEDDLLAVGMKVLRGKAGQLSKWNRRSTEIR